jgi:hypothetical protein
MKRRAISIVCALALCMAGATSASAGTDPAAIVVDTALVRPGCLVATVLGSAFFVISLPIAAISKSVHSSANALVVVPAQATFTRPLGDLDALMYY